ncbi:hypothetical protein GO730_37480 [Spirosoma sp. HMF3257]|uniref:Uncharacterized protein n=1 Tax=Spirosoma telluris TaxID=2183553 RepID=A0A327NEE9_9BACT|nr:hypothetical protein [Spirosoma telluris]RAI73083.1 hypothetical protein HMF3257_37410 [Spirosoma telluris]
MAKSFGLISKSARNKAAEQGTKTLNNTDGTESTSEVEAVLQQNEQVPVAQAEELVKPDAIEPASPPVLEAVNNGPLQIITPVADSIETEPNTTESADKAGTTIKKGGKSKKKVETPAPTPLNAARVSARAHKLLNMISSLENKTQSAIIDELIVLHPLYPKLKALVEAVG